MKSKIKMCSRRLSAGGGNKCTAVYFLAVVVEIREISGVRCSGKMQHTEYSPPPN